MAVSYNKLWKLLIDKNMKKKELGEAAGISNSLIAKLGKKTKMLPLMYWLEFAQLLTAE